MKILVIDDNDISVKYWKDFILNSSGVTHDYETACNYDSARLFLKDHFDLVLCDNKLGGDKFGIDLVCDYLGIWPEAMCFLYSQDSEILNRASAKKIKCYSILELENELTMIFDNRINDTPRYAEAMTMQTNTLKLHTDVLDTRSQYNKELCGALHEQNKEEHLRIEKKADARIDQISNSFDKAVSKVELAIEKTMDGNKKIFFVTLGVFATMVASLAVTLIKG